MVAAHPADIGLAGIAICAFFVGVLATFGLAGYARGSVGSATAGKPLGVPSAANGTTSSSIHPSLDTSQTVNGPLRLSDGSGMIDAIG